MMKLLFLFIFLTLPAIAGEPVSIETARTKSIALVEAITKAHDHFRDLRANENLDNADFLLPILKPLAEAVQAYDKLRREDEKLSAPKGLGFTTQFRTYDECGSAGQMLSAVIGSYGNPDSDQTVKLRAAFYRLYLASILTCQLKTGQQTIPAALRTTEGLNREILNVLDQAMSGLVEYSTRMAIENDTVAKRDLDELDWMYHVDIAGPVQVMGVYLGLEMKELYWSLAPVPACFAAFNSFTNILDFMDKNLRIDHGAASDLSQLEKSYLRERNLCEAEI